MQRSMLVICAIMLLLPTWMGVWPDKALAVEVAPGYTFERLTPDNQYAFKYMMDVGTHSEENVCAADISNHRLLN